MITNQELADLIEKGSKTVREVHHKTLELVYRGNGVIGYGCPIGMAIAAKIGDLREAVKAADARHDSDFHQSIAGYAQILEADEAIVHEIWSAHSRSLIKAADIVRELRSGTPDFSKYAHYIEERDV